MSAAGLREPTSRRFGAAKRGWPRPSRGLRTNGVGCYHMRVRRLLTLILITALSFVSSTSVAAALCGHRDAQAHQAALHGGDRQVAAAAQLEEAAGALTAKKGTLADAGSFALPAFVLPSSSLAPVLAAARQAPAPAGDAVKIARWPIPPLLEPPAA